MCAPRLPHQKQVLMRKAREADAYSLRIPLLKRVLACKASEGDAYWTYTKGAHRA